MKAGATGSEEDVASIMDELFDLEQAGEALIPTSISETAVYHQWPISGDNARRAASSNRGSELVEWVKTLLNKVRENCWSAGLITGLQSSESKGNQIMKTS